MGSTEYEKKDHADLYRLCRPTYPHALFERIVSYHNHSSAAEVTAQTFTANGPRVLDEAIDVGCGSGHSTIPLSKFCHHVTAVDASAAQLSQTIADIPNISFKLGTAEELPALSSSTDLITVAMALHWFNIPSFYKEADRVLKPGGILAVYGYSFVPRLRCAREDIQTEANVILDELFESLLSEGYWADKSAYPRQLYHQPDIQIPYVDRCRVDDLKLEMTYSLRQFMGYLKSRSGIYKFIDSKPAEAEKILGDVERKLSHLLEDTESVCYEHSIFLLMGRKPKA